MMRLKKMLFALVLMLGIVAVPTVIYATPGTVTVDGINYGYSAMFSVYNPTWHSPTVFSTNEKRYTVHVENYMYRIKETMGTSGEAMIAMRRISDGQWGITPTYLTSANTTPSVFLNGDYYLYVWNINSSLPIYTALEIDSVAPGSVTITGSTGGYLLKGSTYQVSASVQGIPTSVTASVTDAAGTTNLGTLTTSDGYNYSLNYTFNTSYQLSGGGTVKPLLKIQANYASGGSVATTTPIYVTTHNASYYQSVDSTWYYNSQYDNSFIGVANPNQMCYEFVVDEPSTVEPLQIQADIIAFMTKGVSSFHDFTTRPGITYSTWSLTPIANADAVYFQNFHFAKVTAWDASGNPTRLESKWGPDEANRSTSVNAFAGGIYGSPVIYFKK